MIRVDPATRPQDPNRVVRKESCTHGRLIDDVLTAKGTQSGQLVCLECKALFPNPRFQKPLD